tara:strand:+ start:592 stop:2136 length:1545 start_codon:yes stop_codon:yes gene_type:complete
VAEENFLERLANVSSDKTVKDSIDKNIQQKVDQNLTPNERARLKNEATIFAETFLKVKKKKEPDTFGKTSTSTANTPAMVAQQTAQQAKKPPKLNLSLLALGAGITAFANFISDFLGPVGEFVAKTLPKLLKPLGKLAGGFFKAIKGGKLMSMLTGIAGTLGKRLIKFGRFIPVIGSLFSFGFGIKRWTEGDYMNAILEFVSGILNILPTGVGNIASIIIDGYLLLNDLNKTEKGEEQSIDTGGEFSLWGKIREFALNLPGVKNIIELGKGYAAIFKGDFSAAANHFRTALPFIGAIVDWLANAAVRGGVAAGQFLANAGIDIGSPGAFFKSIGEKFISVFKDMVNSIYDWITGTVDDIVSGVKDIGGNLLSGAKDIGGGIFNAITFGAFQDDFMVRGNKVIPFNDKDDVVGMKEGGALSKLIHSGTTQGVVIKDVFDKAVTSEIQRSNQYLAQLVQLTAQMVTGQGSNVTPVPVMNSAPSTDMPGSMEGPAYRDSRSNFYNSPYSMHTPGVLE